VRRALRALARFARPRNVLTTLSVVLSLAILHAALNTPPPRSSAHRTDAVLRALGLPPEEAGTLTAPDSVPTLTASPRFVLPLTREPERWALREPLRPSLPTARPAPAVEPPTAPPTEQAPPVVAALPPVEQAPPVVAAPPPTERASAAPALVRPKPPPPQLAAAVVMSPVLPRRQAPAPPTGAPALAIVIDDVGPAVAQSRRAIRLPRPVTLAFLPYAEDIAGMAAAARANGHEVFLHLPMEPEGSENPGPNAILVALDAGETSRRLAYAFDRVPQAVGVNNHMGSRATSDPASMLRVLQEVKRRGLAFVDSRTSPLSVGAALADRLEIPNAPRDVFLDNDPSTASILRQLGEAERTARRRGRALAIGHPYPTTLAALEQWLPQAERRGVRIVRATELIALRDCRPQVVAVSACTGPDCPPLPPSC